MTEDVQAENYFVDLTLYRCRMKDSCYFAAKNELDFEEHAREAHPNIRTSFEKITAEELPPGTVLLKCQLCDFLIADTEVDDAWKRHYRSARVRPTSDEILWWNIRTQKLHHAKEGDDESRLHNSYILAQVEEQKVSEENDSPSSQTELEFIQIPTP